MYDTIITAESRKSNYKYVNSEDHPCVGLGVAMIVASENVIATMQQGIGVFLIINALLNIWYIIRLSVQARKSQKA